MTSKTMAIEIKFLTFLSIELDSLTLASFKIKPETNIIDVEINENISR